MISAFALSRNLLTKTSIYNSQKTISIPKFDNRILQRTAIISRKMTSAYTGEIGNGKKDMVKINYLPIETKLKDGTKVKVTNFEEEDWDIGMELMNLIIREGKSWPFTEEFETMDSYRAYFLSHSAFVVKSMEEVKDVNGKTHGADQVLGVFYVKPNFPGRCSHICNGGFITHPDFRRNSVATIMGKSFLKLAKDLGYKSSYFNLVFKSNEASIRLWESLGFERVAELKNAADLKGVEGLDTAYGYQYNLEDLPDDYSI